MTQTFKNHGSAIVHSQAVNAYIVKELQTGCLLGPFITSPWSTDTAVSPMSTRPKKLSMKRRILMDLLWPEGYAVNDGIPGDTYMGQPIALVYPNVDLLCRRAAELGSECMGFKLDLDCAFKQIVMSPDAWLILGIFLAQYLFYDKTAIMGSRSAPYVCQRMTSFICHIMNSINYFIANYVDDFMGLEHADRVWAAYNALGNLLRDLGISKAIAKAIPPTHIIEFLGVWYNLIDMTISVTQHRIQKLQAELQQWDRTKWYNLKRLQSLVGKLQFISNSVRPGRVMVLRLRNELRQTTDTYQHPITAEMRKDLHWWQKFLCTYNGVSLM